MRIYRVETPEQLGPYRPQAPRHGAWNEDRCPSPYEDGLDHIQLHTHHYGFRTLAQVKSWFHKPEDRAKLRRAGFKLSVYEIDPEFVHVGGKQVAFKLNAATRVEMRTL